MILPTFTHMCAILFTVALLCTSVYFLLGSIPLLILKHDTPIDGKFIRSFFNVYYRMATVVAGAAALSYAFSSRPWFAVGAALIMLLSIALQRFIIRKMDVLSGQIQSTDFEAIPAFRKTHVIAVVISFVQMVVVIAGLMAFKL